MKKSNQKNQTRVPIGLKTAIGIVGISIVLSSTMILLSYVNFKSNLLEMKKAEEQSLAELIAGQIDDSIWSNQENQFSQKKMNAAKQLLTNFREVFGNLDIHIFNYNDEKLLYVVGTSDKNSALRLVNDDKSSHDFRTKIKGKVITSLEMKDNLDNTYGFIIVESSTQTIQDNIRKFLILLITAVIEVTFVLILLYLVLVNVFIIKPITNLAQFTGEFIRTGQTVENRLEKELIHTKYNEADEIGDLYESVMIMEQGIREYIKEITEFTADKERMNAELNIARQIQESMLPDMENAQMDHSCFLIHAEMHPAKEVGGDFYDCFFVDECRLAVVIADVSGKSVPGALFMSIAKILIKIHLQREQLPSKAIGIVNNQLFENNQANMFVTAFAGILDLNTGEFVYTNAGHNYPVLVSHKGKGSYLKEKHGFVLGGLEGISYKQSTCFLCEGERIYIYTDGVTEAENESKELFGEERLLNVLEKSHTEKDGIHQAVNRLMEEIGCFVKDTPQTDDITILALEYKGTHAVEEGRR